MDNLAAVFAYILIFWGFYALALWCGPRYKTSRAVASKPQPPALVILPGQESALAISKTHEDNSQPIISQTHGEPSDLAVAQANEVTSDPAVIQTNGEISGLAVSQATEETPELAGTQLHEELPYLAVSQINGDTSLVLSPSDHLDPLAQQASTQAIGLLKSKGMEGEASDLEQEIVLDERINAQPTFENR